MRYVIRELKHGTQFSNAFSQSIASIDLYKLCALRNNNWFEIEMYQFIVSILYYLFFLLLVVFVNIGMGWNWHILSHPHSYHPPMFISFRYKWHGHSYHSDSGNNKSGFSDKPFHIATQFFLLLAIALSQRLIVITII